MNLFLDTCSLLKMYHRESGTDELLALITNGIENIYLSELAKTEFNSAIYKKVRTREFSEDMAKEMVNYFENDFANFKWITVNSETINQVKELIKKHDTVGLRTLDSIQLACALAKKDEIQRFKTSDKILKSIFIAEELEIC